MEFLWFSCLMHQLVSVLPSVDWLRGIDSSWSDFCAICAWFEGHRLGWFGLGLGTAATAGGAGLATGPGSDGGMTGGSNVDRNSSTKAPDPWTGTGFDPSPAPTPYPIPDNRPSPPEFRNADESYEQKREWMEENEQREAIKEMWDDLWNEIKNHEPD
jgi:hypothetical protein